MANNQHEKETFHGAGGLLLTLGIELVLYVLIMAIFLDHGGTTLIIDVILAVAAIVYFKCNHAFADKIKATLTANRKAAWGGIIVLLLAVPFVLQASAYWLFIVITAGLFMMACLGLNLQLGSTGMMNLAGAAFQAFGAYTAGLLALNYGLPTWLTLLAGALVTGLFSILLFIPVLKTKGHYLALVTIAFQFMVVILVENMAWTGGPQGLKNIPLMSFFGYSFNEPLNLGFITLHKYANYYYFALLLLFALGIAAHRIYHSWVGITAATIRDDEVAAQTNGVQVNKWKLTLFILGNCFIGLSGAFYSHMVGFISPPNFAFDKSLVMVSIVILGGMDNVLGIILGAFLLIILPEKLRFIQDYRFMIYGIVLIVMLIFQPRGLLPFVPRNYAALIQRYRHKLLQGKEAQGGQEA